MQTIGTIDILVVDFRLPERWGEYTVFNIFSGSLNDAGILFFLITFGIANTAGKVFRVAKVR